MNPLRHTLLCLPLLAAVPVIYATSVVEGEFSGATRGADSIDIQSKRLDPANDVAAGVESLTLGTHNQAFGSWSMSIGSGNDTLQNYSAAVGYDNSVNATNAFAFGKGIINNTANSLMFGPSNAAKVTILSNGNVGIGTIAPQNLLSLGSAISDRNLTGAERTYATLGFQVSGANFVPAKISAVQPNLAWQDAADLTFFTGGGTNITEKLRITAYGDVGIGTNAPGAKLEVAGNIKISNNGSIITSSGNALGLPSSGGGTLVTTSGNQTITGSTTLNGATTVVGTTTLGGNVGIGMAPSTNKLAVNGTMRLDDPNSSTRNIILDPATGTVSNQSTINSARFYGLQMGPSFASNQPVFKAKTENTGSYLNSFFGGYSSTDQLMYSVRADGLIYSRYLSGTGPGTLAADIFGNIVRSTTTQGAYISNRVARYSSDNANATIWYKFATLRDPSYGGNGSSLSIDFVGGEASSLTKHKFSAMIGSRGQYYAKIINAAGNPGNLTDSGVVMYEEKDGANVITGYSLYIKLTGGKFTGGQVIVADGSNLSPVTFYDIVSGTPTYGLPTNSLVPPGVLVFDTTDPTNYKNIFVDYISDRTGLGTTAPAAKLDVNGTVQISGNVTIKNVGATKSVIRISPAGDIPMIAGAVGTNPNP